MKKLLICTDLDRTLLPNGEAPESPDAAARFAQLVSRPEVTLAYVSGRHSALVQSAIEEYKIPLPHWVIGDVGTTMYQVSGDRWQYSSSWEAEISKDWLGFKASDLPSLFADIADLTDLTLQEDAKQNHYKLSYYLPLETDLQPLQNCMRNRLKENNIEATLIYSIDESAAIGLLDILPTNATKLHAVEFLMQQQGFDHSNTVFAGDSGNDLPVLASAVPAILVANADEDTIAQAQFQTQQNGTTDYFYQASGGFLGMNGNYSAGILEGIAHYHPTLKSWME